MLIRLPFAIAPEQSYESGSECPIENGVNDGVYGGWDVSQPQTHVDHMIWHMERGPAGENYIKYEERRPAQDEREEYHPKYL